MSTAEIKKPPVAPKPTFVVGHKTVPPPVAPKPDILLADVLQTVKKTKPAIAPKPKILKCSSVPEVNTIQPSLRKNSRSLEDPKKDSSEFLLQLNYKNGTPRDNAAYIISVCSCKYECVHKFGNGENLYKNPTIFEQLENLENIGTDEQSASSSLKTRTEPDIHNRKKMNKNRAVLNTNLLEEKFKGLLTQSIFPNSSHLKQKPLNKLEMGNFNSFNDYVNVELTDFVPVASSPEEVMDCPNNHIKIACVESERAEIPPLTENISGCSCSLDTALEKTDNIESHMSTSTKGGNESFPSSGTDSATSAKSLPVPKPRKLRASGLVRQDGIDIPGERIKETFASECETMGFSDCAVGKTTKINVLVQSVSYNNQEHTPESNKSKIASCVAGKMYLVAGSLESDSKEMTPQNFLPGGSHQGKNVEHSSDLYSTNSSNNLRESNSMLAVNDKNASFIRSSNLSKSLPKQLKLSCSQDLPAFENLHNSAQEKENKNDHLKSESSTKIIPKKPQRQCIPGTGLLKKAASEELLERSTYLSNEEHSQTPLEGPPIRHLSAKEQSSLLSQNLPKFSLEKPAWKLPHPILPFSGNPEALKNTKNAKNSEFRSPLTKPRAKSLSSVDMDRIQKPPKEPPKKNSLKKFLNIKLSICLMKSDFQKFLIKSSQSTDNTTAAFSHQEELGKNCNVTNMINRRKTKPAKAHSAEVGSLSLQKGKEKSRNQDDATKSQRSKSLDEQTFSSQRYLSSLTHDYVPEYENVSHYEEIPEYENLPFASADKKTCYESHNTKILEDHEANVYEVEELYEPTRICSKFGRSLAEDFGGSDLVLEDAHSDDELILRDVSSSDEDADTNSDSSKGELDTQENEQINTAGKKTKVYHIAKEIMSSEKVFVDVLKLLHIDFRDAVTHASRQLGKPVIEDRILNQILYYLPQLYELNRDLLRELEERLSHWIDNERIADIFLKKGHYLKMYSTYIKEFDRNVTLLDEQCRKNPGFAAVVRDFEMSPRCANLALKHYLLKPVQRIPQYRLLLTDYLKNLSEDSADFRDTKDALAVVIEVANHANDIMKQGDNFQKLMQIQYSLNGHCEIVQPGRVFLKEGTLMKLSRKVMQPRMFFLFNDALLYTTPMQSGVYKLNNMLSLAGMKVRKPIHEAYQNELNIESVERSFILSANSATERDEWLEAISRSIEDYTKKRITFNPSKSLEEGDLEKEEEASPIGSKAPIWIPDTRATMCMICTSEFTLTWRRHHCRACGKIICQACSSNKHKLDYMKNNPARVCDLCFKELQKQDNLCTSPKNGSPVSHRSPSNALSTVLHSIPSGRKQKKIPAALKEVSASIEDSSMSGYLYRSKGNKKPWKHLWFVIKNKVLYTYAASEDVAALESQPLLGFTVAEVKDEHLEPKVFHLMHKNTLFYIFKADDAHSMQKWIEAFQEATIL